VTIRAVKASAASKVSLLIALFLLSWESSPPNSFVRNGGP
jgi:hypothetical protein